MSAAAEERRLFSRILFRTEARLHTEHHEFDVQILDLSLKGALVQPRKPWISKVGERCVLRIYLDTLGTQIRMEGDIVHRQGNYLGLRCQAIDLDSVTHLRRLVELNLGNPADLERELVMLMTPEQPFLGAAEDAVVTEPAAAASAH